MGEMIYLMYLYYVMYYRHIITSSINLLFISRRKEDAEEDEMEETSPLKTFNQDEFDEYVFVISRSR